MRELLIGKNDAGQRVDRFLQKRFPSLPASSLQKALRLKDIKLNGRRALRDDRLAEGDTLRVYITDEQLDAEIREEHAFLRIENPSLSVVYEDENILLLDKPSGLLCHSDDREAVNTLLSRMQAYLYKKGEFDPDVENSFSPALCNRIDRNTRGIVIAAKNAEALRIMNEKIRLHEIEKYYLCLVKGAPKPPAGALEGYILRDMEKKRVSVLKTPRPSARYAKTVYRTLETRGKTSLVECRLITGRTHQIRAQMAAAGNPLVGDGKYGTLNRGENDGQALVSYRVVFTWKTDAGALGYLNGREFSIEAGF